MSCCGTKILIESRRYSAPIGQMKRLTGILWPEHGPPVVVVKHVCRERFLQYLASLGIERLVRQLLPCLFLRGLLILRFLWLVRGHGVHRGLRWAAGASWDVLATELELAVDLAQPLQLRVVYANTYRINLELIFSRESLKCGKENKEISPGHFLGRASPRENGWYLPPAWARSSNTSARSLKNLEASSEASLS